MSNKTKIIVIGSLAFVAALALSACGVVQFAANHRPTAAPGYNYGPGMMNGSGMMGGYNYNPSGPTAVPTPLGATPAPVDEELQITAANLRFTPAQVTVKPGETVRFVVTNRDPFLHNFVSQAAGIPFLNLPGNTTQTVTWTAPTTPGTYTAVCTLHPGMSLTVSVKN